MLINPIYIKDMHKVFCVTNSIAQVDLYIKWNQSAARLPSHMNERHFTLIRGFLCLVWLPALDNKKEKPGGEKDKKE